MSSKIALLIYGLLRWDGVKNLGPIFFTSVELNIFEFFFFLSCPVMVLIVWSQFQWKMQSDGQQLLIP